MCCLVAVAGAAPQFNQNTSPIIAQPEVRVITETFDNDDSGNYEYSYEQDNGQRVRTASTLQ